MEKDPNAKELRSSCIFERDGDVFLPTGLATGPWYAGTQHGSAMLGLLAQAVETHPSDSPSQVVRQTVDMMRAAPMAPVAAQARTYRKTRNAEFVEASLTADGEEFARATAMRFRVNPIAVSDEWRGETRQLQLPPAATFDPIDHASDDQEAFHQSLEIRPVPGFELPVMWIRLRVPFIGGEETSPLVRAAVASDFTYSMPMMRKAMSNPESYRDETFAAINADTSINLHRPMHGEWVGLYCRVFYSDLGAGSARSELHDESGVIGHVSQSLLVRDITGKPPAWRDDQKSSS
jgi:hypothetical protein